MESDFTTEFVNALGNNSQEFADWLLSPVGRKTYADYHTLFKLVWSDPCPTPGAAPGTALTFNQLADFLESEEMVKVLAGDRDGFARMWIKQAWLSRIAGGLMKQSRWGLVKLLVDSVPGLDVRNIHFDVILKEFKKRGWSAEDFENLQLVFKAKVPISAGSFLVELEPPLPWLKAISDEWFSRPARPDPKEPGQLLRVR